MLKHLATAIALMGMLMSTAAFAGLPSGEVPVHQQHWCQGEGQEDRDQATMVVGPRTSVMSRSSWVKHTTKNR